MPRKQFIFFLIWIIGAKSLDVQIKPRYRSDAIQTYWPETKRTETVNETPQDNPEDPNLMKQLLRKFGEMASKIGNSVGSGASIITNAIDKVCEVVKTVIPLLTAVCHVGQFKFCAATTGAPEGIKRAVNSGYDELNLDIPD
ncbi:unnamed protein product [Phyllotreta striolata]|uniref:Uncharacterized protein n=1 Tax=Phyllotreta striolata TaxID=444603 RepID=A0A9N9TM26_PHYSR|nr:unnamed protein product [Phyllotreta striolata]